MQPEISMSKNECIFQYCELHQKLGCACFAAAGSAQGVSSSWENPDFREHAALFLNGIIFVMFMLQNIPGNYDF